MSPSFGFYYFPPSLIYSTSHNLVVYQKLPNKKWTRIQTTHISKVDHLEYNSEKQILVVLSNHRTKLQKYNFRMDPYGIRRIRFYSWSKFNFGDPQNTIVGFHNKKYLIVSVVDQNLVLQLWIKNQFKQPLLHDIQPESIFELSPTKQYLKVYCGRTSIRSIYRIDWDVPRLFFIYSIKLYSNTIVFTANDEYCIIYKYSFTHSTPEWIRLNLQTKEIQHMDLNFKICQIKCHPTIRSKFFIQQRPTFKVMN